MNDATNTAESFQDRIDRERAERREKAQELAKLATYLCSIEPFKSFGYCEVTRTNTDAENDSYAPSATMKDPKTGRSIDLTVGRYEAKDRLTIDGNYPRGRNSYVTGRDNPPRITVNPTRGAHAIAAEIVRRFLTPYHELFDKLAGRVREEQGRHAKIILTGQWFYRLLDKPFPDYKRERTESELNVTEYLTEHQYLNLRTWNGDEFELKVDHLTKAQVEKIIRMLKED